MKQHYTLIHQDKPIYFIDFSNIKTVDEIKSIITQTKDYIHQQPPKSLLVLVSINMMHISTDIKDLFLEYLDGNRRYINASAVVGLNSLTQIVFKSTIRKVRRDIKSFNDIEQAKNWLVAKMSINEVSSINQQTLS